MSSTSEVSADARPVGGGGSAGGGGQPSARALGTLRDPARPVFAFLGCGQAARMHARTLAKVGRGTRWFFASRDAARAKEFAERHGGEGAFGDYASALSDERVDVAVVVTPPASHLEWTLRALDAGKHVIVEKPAFLRSSDFTEVEQASARAGRQVLVAENYFYKPLAETLRKVFREGTLGRVLFLHVNALKTQNAEGWRLDPSLAGGGALFEGGVHWISLLAHLGPEVRSAHAVVPGPKGGGEKSILVTLTYDRGAVAALSYSWEVPSLPGGLRISRIYGTEGSAAFESNGVFFATTGRRWRVGVPGLRDLLGYKAMFADFVDSLAGARAPRFTLTDARRDVELIEEAYRSAGIRAS